MPIPNVSHLHLTQLSVSSHLHYHEPPKPPLLFHCRKPPTTPSSIIVAGGAKPHSAPPRVTLSRQTIDGRHELLRPHRFSIAATCHPSPSRHSQRQPPTCRCTSTPPSMPKCLHNNLSLTQTASSCTSKIQAPPKHHVIILKPVSFPILATIFIFPTTLNNSCKQANIVVTVWGLQHHRIELKQQW